VRGAVAGLAGAAAAALLAFGGGRAAVVGGALLVLIAGAPTAWRLRRDVLDAPGLYALSSMLMFGLVTLAWLGDPVVPPPGIGRAHVGEACAVVALGLVAFGIGARLACGPPRRTSVPGLSGRELPDWRPLLALFCGSLAATVAGIAIGRYGFVAATSTSTSVAGSSFAFALTAAVGVLVTVTFGLLYFRTGDRRLGRLLALTTVVQVAVGFAAGFKGQSIGPVLAVGLAYVASGGRVPWKAVAGIAVLGLLVLLPANTAYRAALRHPDARTPQGVAELAYRAMRPDRSVTAAGRYVSMRLRAIDSVALVQSQTPSVYARGDGTRYALLPLIVLVPRALWPGKPVLDDGVQFSWTYWQLPPNQVSASPITQVGDLLRNFGVAGVLGGMLVWGAVVGAFTLLRRRRPSLRMDLVFVYALVYWLAFMAPELDLPSVLATATKTLVLVVAFAWLFLPGTASPPGYRVLAARIGSAR
jgi:hypothetical protein